MYHCLYQLIRKCSTNVDICHITLAFVTGRFKRCIESESIRFAGLVTKLDSDAEITSLVASVKDFLVETYATTNYGLVKKSRS